MSYCILSYPPPRDVLGTTMQHSPYQQGTLKEHRYLDLVVIVLVLLCCRYISEPTVHLQKSFSRGASVHKTPSGVVTPSPRKGTPVRSMNSRASAGTAKVASRIPNTR